MRRALLLLAIAAAAVAQPIPSGSPTGPAGGAASGSYPNICLAGITCGTVVPTMNCSPGVTSDYLNTATAKRYYCSATNAWTVGQSVAGNLSVGTSVLQGTGANLISTDQSTPATPSAGTTAFYSKSGTMCSKNSAGVESCGFGLSLTNPIGGSPTANAILYADGSGNLQNAPGITRTGSAQLTVGTATSPGNEIILGTPTTDSASLGSELTTSGTCSGTGWTGTYPNYTAPATTTPLTCTGFTSGNLYQIGATITNNAGVTGMTYASGLSCTGTGTYPLTVTGGGGSGATGTITVTSGVVTAAIAVVTHGTAFTSAPTTGTLGTPTGSASCTGTLVMTSTVSGGTITGAIGTAQSSASSSAASSTYSFSPRANGTSLTYTPTTTFVGTIAVTAKQINPITTFSYIGKDSTGAVSYEALYQGLASLHNTFSGGGGSYNTTGGYNSAQGALALFSNTTGGNNSAHGYAALYSNTTGGNNSAQGFQALYSNTTGSYNSAQGVGAGYTATAANANVSGSNNSWFGYDSGPGSPTQYNYQSVIGAAATGTCSNCVVLGRAGGLDTVYAGDAGVDPMVVLALATTPVLTINLKICTATTGIPWRASVTDAVAPALGVALTGGGGVFANVHCSLTTGTYIVDGI